MAAGFIDFLAVATVVAVAVCVWALCGLIHDYVAKWGRR